MLKLSKPRKIIIATIIAILFLVICLYLIHPKINRYLIDQQNKKTIEEISLNEEKESTHLEVPFICQAPLQTEKNWKYHEESCEEAAVLQAYLYQMGQTMSKEQAHEEILKMTDWQVENFGEHRDIYADDVKKFINGYYDMPLEEIEIVYNASLEDIETYLLKGYPVIVPIMGDILDNPYYPHPGYHMLIATGYTEDRIITNDNGTRRGENFSYDKETFSEAMNSAGGDIVVIKAKTTTSSH